MNTPNHTTDPTQQPDGTVFESFDDWAQLLRQSGNSEPRTEHDGPQDPITSSTGANAATHPDAPAFRPTLRRPMALLKIVDDGHEDGETVRIRGDTFVIGRIFQCPPAMPRLNASPLAVGSSPIWGVPEAPA